LARVTADTSPSKKVSTVGKKFSMASSMSSELKSNSFILAIFVVPSPQLYPPQMEGVNGINCWSGLQSSVAVIWKVTSNMKLKYVAAGLKLLCQVKVKIL
jgi:hypothetical protein